jgi:plasmid maintenance system antidote protein VapI
VDVGFEASMRSDKTPIYSIELGRISQALISSGYTSLDEQARALGVHRSTAWMIIKNKHKLGRLSAKTIDRILGNPQTPLAVRMVVQQYVTKRSERKLRPASSSKALSENKRWPGPV